MCLNAKPIVGVRSGGDTVDSAHVVFIQQRNEQQETRQRRATSVSTLECPKERVVFHKTLSALINLHNNPDKKKKEPEANATFKRQQSEQEVYTIEWRDMLWLELQAYIAGLNVTEFDARLSRKRIGCIQKVIGDVLSFKFQTNSWPSSKPLSPVCEADDTMLSGDVMTASGASSSSAMDTLNGSVIDLTTFDVATRSLVPKALKIVIREQKEALSEVEQLLRNLAYIESLYPTSKALGSSYPTYATSSFQNRLQSMCLWFNVTRDIASKLSLMASVLFIDAIPGIEWPWLDSDSPFQQVHNVRDISDVIIPNAPEPEVSRDAPEVAESSSSSLSSNERSTAARKKENCGGDVTESAVTEPHESSNGFEFIEIAQGTADQTTASSLTHHDSNTESHGDGLSDEGSHHSDGMSDNELNQDDRLSDAGSQNNDGLSDAGSHHSDGLSDAGSHHNDGLSDAGSHHSDGLSDGGSSPNLNKEEDISSPILPCVDSSSNCDESVNFFIGASAFTPSPTKPRSKLPPLDVAKARASGPSKSSTPNPRQTPSAERLRVRFLDVSLSEQQDASSANLVGLSPEVTTGARVQRSLSNLSGGVSRSNSSTSIDELTNRTSVYRRFVEKHLKKMGLRKLLARLRVLLDQTLQRARQTLEMPRRALLHNDRLLSVSSLATVVLSYNNCSCCGQLISIFLRLTV